jgi:hypothetical protein
VRGSAVGSDPASNVRALAVALAGVGEAATGEVRLIHRLAGTVVGVWRGEVACASTQGGTALLSGRITQGEERAQNQDLAGRSFRVGVTGGSLETFQVEVAPPGVEFDACSEPTTAVNTVTEGDLVLPEAS